MSELLKNELQETITLSYLKEDSNKVLAYLFFITRLAESGQKVPARVIKKCINLFQEADLQKNALIKEFLEPKKISVLQKLTNKKGYNFSLLDKKKDKRTLEIFLDVIFDEISTSFEIVNDKKNGKDKLIELSYKYLYAYLQNLPKKKQLTSYKYTVIVGYIVAEFGFLSNESGYSGFQYYQQYLNNSTKFLCKKLKNKYLIQPPEIFPAQFYKRLPFTS